MAMASYDGIPYVDQYFASINMGTSFMAFTMQLYLYGIFISNFFAYLRSSNYKRGSRVNAVLIWTVVVLNSGATALDAGLMMYHGCDQNRGQQAIYQLTVPDQLLTVPLGLIGCITQSFLALRASKLFKRTPWKRTLFLVVVFTMVSLALVACMTLPVITSAFAHGWVDKFGPFDFNVVAAIWLWLSATVDVMLTTTLILCLRRSVLGFNQQTDSAIRAIIRAALQSAVPTAVFALAGAVLSISWGATNGIYSILWQLPALPLGSLYALSLLTTLRARKKLSRRGKQKQAVVGSPNWWNRSADLPLSPGEALGRKRVVLAVGLLGRGSAPIPVGSPVALGITFTRDVVQSVEQGDEPLQMREDYNRPYLESYSHEEEAHC